MIRIRGLIICKKAHITKKANRTTTYSLQAFYHLILLKIKMRIRECILFLLFAISSSIMVQCHPVNKSNPPKRGLDIDLNQEYVPDNSSPNSIPHAERQHSYNPLKEQRPYIYRKRKAESEYSQNPNTKRSRERMEYMRKNDKEAFDAYRKGEKERLAHVKERDKELTKKHGISMRRNDINVRQIRARIKQGIASKEDVESNEKRKNLYKQYRISLKEAGIKRNQDSKMIEAKQRQRQGIATKEDLDRIEKKRLADKKQYEKKKKAKLANKV